MHTLLHCCCMMLVATSSELGLSGSIAVESWPDPALLGVDGSKDQGWLVLSRMLDGAIGCSGSRPGIASTPKGILQIRELKVARTFKRIRKKIREINEYWLFTF